MREQFPLLDSCPARVRQLLWQGVRQGRRAETLAGIGNRPRRRKSLLFLKGDMALCEEQSVPCLPIFPSQGKLVPVLYLLEQWGSLPGERSGGPSAVLRQSRSITVRPLDKGGVRPRYWFGP